MSPQKECSEKSVFEFPNCTQTFPQYYTTEKFIWIIFAYLFIPIRKYTMECAGCDDLMCRLLVTSVVMVTERNLPGWLRRHAFGRDTPCERCAPHKPRNVICYQPVEDEQTVYYGFVRLSSPHGSRHKRGGGLSQACVRIKQSRCCRATSCRGRSGAYISQLTHGRHQYYKPRPETV